MSQTIHKALKLPSPYRVYTSVTGHVRIGPAHHEQRLVELRMLRTDTLGQEAVFAVKVVHGDGQWKEINGTGFERLAHAVIFGTEITAQDRAVWGIQ